MKDIGYYILFISTLGQNSLHLKIAQIITIIIKHFDIIEIYKNNYKKKHSLETLQENVLFHIK